MCVLLCAFIQQMRILLAGNSSRFFDAFLRAPSARMYIATALVPVVSYCGSLVFACAASLVAPVELKNASTKF